MNNAQNSPPIVNWETVNKTIAVVMMLIENKQEFRTRDVVKLLERENIVVTGKPETAVRIPA
jgi:hypothetical protein